VPVVVSSNRGKAREIEAILGCPVERIDLDLTEIQALDVEVVARQKALAAYGHVARPVIVEDTGLTIDALRGLPGALVRWFLATVGAAGLCAMIPDGAERGATARTAVAWCDGDTVEVLVGETRGTIAPSPRGSRGFGWDAIFQPDGSARTFAEMDDAEKRHYSMRRRALEQLRPLLDPS
jgi:non-canonical purine NTP pyrophosphatase (RdgB/HAM1 family)